MTPSDLDPLKKAALRAGTHTEAFFYIAQSEGGKLDYVFNGNWSQLASFEKIISEICSLKLGLKAEDGI